MIDKNTRQEVEPSEYGIDTEDIKRRAREILNGNREYRRLQEQLKKIDCRREMVKLSMTQTRLRQMESEEIDRLWLLEMEHRKNINGIGGLLRRKDKAEYDRWQELLAGLSFTIDLMDYAVHDINELLDRNSIGIKLEKFKEVEGMRELMKQLTNDSMNNSDDWKKEMWWNESDSLWEHMKERCAAYREEVDRILAEKGKTGSVV